MTTDDAAAEGSSLLRTSEFTVSAGDVRALADARATEMQATYKLKGFRPGKVPMEQILQRHGPELRQEALEKLARQRSEEIVAEARGRGERPLAEPQMDLLEGGGADAAVEEGTDQRFELRYEVRPEVPDISTLGLSLACPRVATGEEDVDAEIQRHFEANPIYAGAEAGRSAQKGDRVLVDVVRSEGGKETARSDEHGIPIRLGAAEFGEEVDQALEGTPAGGSVQVENEGSGPESPAHVLDFTLREVSPPVPYESSDSFAAAAGLETLGKMREEGWRRVNLRAATARRRILHARLYAELSEALSFETPPSMVQQFTARLQSRPEAAELEGDEARMAQTVRRGVRYLLALSEFQDLRKLPLTGQDVLRAFRLWDNDAPVSQGEQAAFVQMADGNPGFQQLFLRLALLEKALDAFVEGAEISGEEEIGLEQAEEAALHDSAEWRSLFL